jgi:hypothetical protein
MGNTGMYFRDAPFAANQDMYLKWIARRDLKLLSRMDTGQIDPNILL